MVANFACLYLLSNILKSNFSPRINLYKLNLMVTYRCNFMCKTCLIWKKKAIDELSISEYERIFSRIHVNWIDVSGGEIFLRDDIKEIFSLIIKSQKRLALLHFSTNGFFTDKIQDLTDYILTNSKVKLVVMVSLDGPEGVHNFIKGINSWRKTINTYRNLSKIKDKRFNIFFGYTINNFNFDRINQTVEELKREIPHIDYSDLHVNIAHLSQRYYANLSLSLDKEKIKNSAESYIQMRKYKLYDPIDYLEYRYHILIKDYLRNNRAPLKCRSLINSVFFAPEGNIFPCSIYDRNLAKAAR